jgi:4a-hydroxytetrahydrobiopterin dehydratase
MKPSSPGRKPVSRTKARNAAMLNLLATPGLGSLVCRRWIAGSGQLVLAVTGSVMICVWCIREIIRAWAQTDFENTPNNNPVALNVLVWGLGLLVLSWLWSLVTSLSLMREASANSLQSLKSFAAVPMPKLEDAQIAPAIATVPNWNRQGDRISRTFQFKDFPAATKFVNAVAERAERAWHHPDIDIRWNKVTLTLTTHDAGGLTQKDFDLARQFDQLSLH